MQNNSIIFQLPTHYLPRVALRLEYLHATVTEACKEIHPVIHNYALQSVSEILHLIQKPELKSRFLKELMRIEHLANKSSRTLPIELYTQLYVQIQVLTHGVGRFGDEIQHEPLLQCVRPTLSSHANDCEMHSPQLLLWLEADPQTRQANLLSWLTALRSLHETVSLYLTLIKHKARYEALDMVNGFYQRQLPPKTSCHLILLKMDKSFNIFPQMQIGHHGLSLRLFETGSMREVRETAACLDLAICQI